MLEWAHRAPLWWVGALSWALLRDPVVVEVVEVVAAIAVVVDTEQEYAAAGVAADIHGVPEGYFGC